MDLGQLDGALTAKLDDTVRTQDSRIGDIVNHTVMLECAAGTLSFEVNEDGDLIHDQPRWTPSEAAWDAIAGAVR